MLLYILLSSFYRYNKCVKNVVHAAIINYSTHSYILIDFVAMSKQYESDLSFAQSCKPVLKGSGMFRGVTVMHPRLQEKVSVCITGVHVGSPRQFEMFNSPGLESKQSAARKRELNSSVTRSNISVSYRHWVLYFETQAWIIFSTKIFWALL